MDIKRIQKLNKLLNEVELSDEEQDEMDVDESESPYRPGSDSDKSWQQGEKDAKARHDKAEKFNQKQNKEKAKLAKEKEKFSKSQQRDEVVNAQDPRWGIVDEAKYNPKELRTDITKKLVDELVYRANIFFKEGDTYITNNIKYGSQEAFTKALEKELPKLIKKHVEFK